MCFWAKHLNKVFKPKRWYESPTCQAYPQDCAPKFVFQICRRQACVFVKGQLGQGYRPLLVLFLDKASILSWPRYTALRYSPNVYSRSANVSLCECLSEPRPQLRTGQLIHPFGSKKINHGLDMNESGANPCQVRRVVVHGYAAKADQTLYAFEQEYCIQ